MSHKKTHPDVTLPKSGVSITATDCNGKPCHITLEFPGEQTTLLISYEPKDGRIQISDPESVNLRTFTVEYGKKGLKIKREKGPEDSPRQISVLSRRMPISDG